MPNKRIIHIDFTSIDADGNQDVLYMRTAAEDVLLRSTSNQSLPVGVTTMKDLVDRFGKLAFLNSLSRENLDENLRNTISDLEKNVAELMYEPVEILSFSPESAIVPMGSSLSTIKFSWKLNKQPTTLSFSGPSLQEDLDPELTSKSFTFASPITETTQFTLTATDEKDGTMEKKTAISFMNYIYYGVSENASNVDLSTLTSELSNTKGRTIEVTAGENEYIFYALPTRLGTPIFNVNSFEGGFIKVGDAVNKENSAGYTEAYDIWRSVNDSLGTLSIIIR